MKKHLLLLTGILCLVSLSAQTQDFTLEDIFKNRTFSARGAGGYEMLADGESYTEFDNTDKGWEIAKYNLRSGEKTGTLVSSTELKTDIHPQSYKISSDEKFILFLSEMESIYRHSTREKAFVLDIAKKTLIPVSTDKIMYATLSPDNQNVAFVKDNNLYIFNLLTKKTTALTKDGAKNKLINGAVDWVYEEEFSMSKGFEWSPDGKYIAYYKFDESAVKEFSMDMFYGLYPNQEKWKYPKAGEDNSKVNVFIATVKTCKSVKCATDIEKDQYVPRIKWTNQPGVLSIQRLNRLQNHWDLMLAYAAKGNTEIILTEKSETYVDIQDNLQFLKNGKKFIYTSEINGYNHIYLMDYSNANNKAIQITNGKFEVLGIQYIDEVTNKIFFTSTEESSTADNLYEIDMSGNNKKKLTMEKGNHVIQFLEGGKYYIDIFSEINVPYTAVLKSTAQDYSRVLEENTTCKERLGKYNFGETTLGTFKTSQGTELNYYMMRPHNFDPNKKYPVLMFVYGGPGINTVRNSWGGRNYLYHQYLTQKGYIVVSVDNRGTGHKGAEFKKCTYLNLGKLEHQDQVEAAKWLKSQSYVDGSRIGVWGWSFGGYMTSLCMTKSADVFKTGIAVAPVTNWRYYDNIYTERFLRKPQDNVVGYDTNSPINFVKNIKGNYLIVHGTADDNVHFQNTVAMINAMVAAGVKFDSEIYPNRNHGIGDGAAQYHLYRRMTEYILEKL